MFAGTPVSVRGASDGGLLVVPDDTYHDDVKVWPRRVARATCGQLTVHQHRPADADERLSEIGVPSDAEVRVFSRRSPIKTDDGRRVGVFKNVDYDRRVWMADRAGRWARVARPTWTGMVWHGWVKAKKLDAPESPDASGYGGLGVAVIQRDPIDVVRCDADRALRVVVRSASVDVATVTAGTPMEVGASVDGGVRVTFPGSVLEPHQDRPFFVPSVDGCTKGTHARGRTEPPRSLELDVAGPEDGGGRALEEQCHGDPSGVVITRGTRGGGTRTGVASALVW